MKFNRRRRREQRSSPLRFLCLLLFIIRRGFFPTLLAFCLLAFSSAAQMQEAWVQRYNGGYTNLDHRPVAMALDGSGNVFVAGSSQSTGTNYDYAVLKYAPAGTQLWAARYAPPAGGTNAVAALALDQAGNAYVTGTGGTVKFGANGAMAWTAPYAGTSLAADTNGNVYVTGFTTGELATVKLGASGSNVWLATFNSHPGYPAVSQKVAVDQAGNIYVSGWAGIEDPWEPFHPRSPWLAKYDPSGAQTWASQCLFYGEDLEISMKALLFDSLGNAYQTGNGGLDGETDKVSPSGQEIWLNSFGPFGPLPGVVAMAVDGAGTVYLTGGAFNTVKVSSGGSIIWISDQWWADNGYTASIDIALDAAGNTYLCGLYTPASSTGTEWATVKLDNNGNLVWSERYTGSANGADAATALAAAPDGSIYVTGYSASTSGGTDITTIKYVQEPTIQLQPGGAMLLQLPGLPGSSAGLGATTNFTAWTELGPVVAGTNGLYQFMDTNAPSLPYRFYRWHAP
jgi:hypothetical protein